MQDFLKHGPKKCPRLGCGQQLTMSDLVPDPELERKIKAHLRREQRRNAAESDQEDMDDDDVVE